ncbi:MAG TPA: uroporphyrinogen-III C-methyltransferase [Chromobacteriaceae bacterium]|nr:uroporphyrinogen-III C-methyltransferase [Chromobacteriaceae bacterium]
MNRPYQVRDKVPDPIRENANGTTGFLPGSVALVGAGPGDPDLLTLRAVLRLQQADAVLYDHLLDSRILDLAPASASRICVGKRASRHTLPQEDINQLLIRFAQQGMRVVRLKGGDPLMFGRGGEELEALAEAGIRCEVVPGISAALGAAASAALPLTHRHYAQGCSFVTGHRREGKEELDWAGYCHPGQTIVVYMGLGQAANIASQLMANGISGDTPIAVVENACSDKQRCLCDALRNLAVLISQQQVSSPALLVIGHVVTLHQKLVSMKTAAQASS